MLDSGSDESLGDLGIDVGEGVGGLVHAVEGGGISDEVGAGMSSGAQIAMLMGGDGVEHLARDVP